MAKVVGRSSLTFAALALTVIITGCGWPASVHVSEADRRTLNAGEAELDRLALPPDWRKTASNNGRHIDGGLIWSREYQVFLGGSEDALDAFDRAAESAGFHQVQDCFPADICHSFDKGEYNLTVSVGDLTCFDLPSAPASAPLDASASSEPEPGCITVAVDMDIF